MKRKLSLLAVLIVSLWIMSGSVAAKTYIDVPAGAYYEEHLQELTEKGVVIPVADGKFRPNTACTRAEFVTYLWRAAGTPAAAALASFKDVSENAEYAAAVAWAQKTGITAGKKDGTFGVNDTVTRAQMVTFLHRFAVYMNYPCTNKTADIGTFADVNALPGHSRTTMPWGVAIGMVTGTKQNTLNPGGLATRAHAIAFIGRLLDSVKEAVPSVPAAPSEPLNPSVPVTPTVPSTPVPEPDPTPEAPGVEWIPEDGELDRDF